MPRRRPDWLRDAHARVSIPVPVLMLGASVCLLGMAYGATSGQPMLLFASVVGVILFLGAIWVAYNGPA